MKPRLCARCNDIGARTGYTRLQRRLHHRTGRNATTVHGRLRVLAVHPTDDVEDA